MVVAEAEAEAPAASATTPPVSVLGARAGAWAARAAKKVAAARITKAAAVLPTSATAPAPAPTEEDGGLREALLPIFAKFDVSGDGRVSIGELRGILSAANVTLSAEKIRDIVSAADADGSDSLDFEEFYGALRKQLGQAAARGDAVGGARFEGGLLSVVSDTGGLLNFSFNPLKWLPIAMFAAPAPPPAASPEPATGTRSTSAASGGRRPLSAPPSRRCAAGSLRQASAGCGSGSAALSVRSRASVQSEALVRQRNAGLAESMRAAEQAHRAQRQERDEAFLDRQHARVRRFRQQERRRQLEVEATRERRRKGGNEMRAQLEQAWRHAQRLEAARKVDVRVQEARQRKRAESEERHRERERTASVVALQAQQERSRRRDESLSTVRRQEQAARDFARHVKYETRPEVRRESRDFFRAQRDARGEEERAKKLEDRYQRGWDHFEFLAGAATRVSDVGLTDRNAAQSRTRLAEQRRQDADEMRVLLSSEQRRKRRNELMHERQIRERHDAAMLERETPLVAPPLPSPSTLSIAYHADVEGEAHDDEGGAAGAGGGPAGTAAGPLRTREALKARSKAWAAAMTTNVGVVVIPPGH